jgi:hypothetical protein
MPAVPSHDGRGLGPVADKALFLDARIAVAASHLE